MASEYHEFAERLARSLTALFSAIETHIRTHFVADEICFCLLRFEEGAKTCRQLVRIFADDRSLWGEFRRAIQAHRKTTHFTMLMEHALYVGQLQGKVKRLQARAGALPAEKREGLSHYVNRIDGEVGLCRDWADRRDLARRINQNAGIPLFDGLTLRAVTYVFGEHFDLWRDFQALVEASIEVGSNPQAITGYHSSSSSS